MFTKEEMEYIKNASKHVEFLLGGRGYNKTHEVIGQSLQENEKLKQALLDIKEILDNKFLESELINTVTKEEYVCISVENYKKSKDIVNKALGDNNGK